MKKLFVSLSLISLTLVPGPIPSISARLNQSGQKQQAAADKSGKIIIACACQDLFPTLQELLVLCKQDIKDLVKLQLNTMNLNKEQLNAVKLMVNDAFPLLLEGSRVIAQCGKKHGKRFIALYQKSFQSNDSLSSESFDEMMDLVISDATVLDFSQKVDAFNEKWAESLGVIMQASAASTVNKEQVTAQVQESVQKMLGAVLANKRAMRIQSVVMPVASALKTQADLIRLVQSCLAELEAQLPAFIVSSENFVVFTVPLLATIIAESIDETLKSMTA